VEGFHTVDPIAADLIDAKKLKPGVGEMTQEMVRRYRREFGEPPPLHVSIGFNNMWILLSDVLPRAIQKHGGWTPDALAAAARETDIPEGGTMQGYGVKFFPPGSPMAGQNERAFPAVYQVQDGKFVLVYPKTFASTLPVLPFPTSSPFAARCGGARRRIRSRRPRATNSAWFWRLRRSPRPFGRDSVPQGEVYRVASPWLRAGRFDGRPCFPIDRAAPHRVYELLWS